MFHLNVLGQDCFMAHYSDTEGKGRRNGALNLNGKTLFYPQLREILKK